MPKTSARVWKAGWIGTKAKMPVTTDILRSYIKPRAVIREWLGVEREDHALATLMAAAALIFVAQWPFAARQAHLDPTVPLDARIGGSLLGVLFLLPLFCYLFAGLSHLVARVFGGKGSFFGARMALFWALLAVSPLMLLQGLVAGFIGPGVQLMAVAILTGVAFLWMWLNMLIEAET